MMHFHEFSNQFLLIPWISAENGGTRMLADLKIHT